MKTAERHKALSDLSSRIATEFGIYIQTSAQQLLPRKLQPALAKLGFSSTDECISWLAANEWQPDHAQALVECLTVSETYFFREAAVWNYLSEVHLPKVANRGEGISVWSAACSTGEEPYTFAMTVDSLSAKALLRPTRIIASDLNASSLLKAEAAEYSSWSLRATPAAIIEKYFHCTGSQYSLSRKLRSAVQFDQFNIMDLTRGQAPPGVPTFGFDIIFCRNVLIYFQEQQSAEIIEELHKYLASDGLLILSTCDIDLAPRSLFDLVSEPGLIILKKRARGHTLALDSVAPRLQPVDELPAMPVRSERSPIAPVPPKAPPVSQNPAKHQHEQKNQDIVGEITPDIEHYLVLLRALSNMGSTEEALSCIDDALTTFPLNELLYFWQAVLFQQGGQDEEAVRALQRAIFLDNNFVMAHFSLFMLFNKLERTAEAETYRRNTQQLLERFAPEEKLPCSDELTAGQIESIMKTLVGKNGR